MTRTLAMAAIALWIVAALGAAYFFVVGRTADSSDGRTAVLLSSAEGEFVLGEMRAMLASTQEITEGLARADYSKIAEAARKSGRRDSSRMPVGLMAKLPLDFKRTGMEMHDGFDDLANAAEKQEDIQSLTQKLADRLRACVGCHETYKLKADR